MNVWELAAEVVIFVLVPLAWLASKGDPRQRLVSFYMAGVVITLLMMLLTMLKRVQLQQSQRWRQLNCLCAQRMQAERAVTV